MNMLCWLLLGFALLISSFGFSIFSSLFLSTFVIIFGSLICLRWIFTAESDHWWFSIYRYHLTLADSSLKSVCDCMPPPKVEEKTDRRITGSNLIDEQLQLIVKYFIRDFIIPWYSHISCNPQFISHLQQGLQQTLVAISSRCKTTDWVSYLTTRLVDDVASHLRIFREAKSITKAKKESPSKELVDHFFDKEAEKEKDICRDNLALKIESEKEYLSDLVEIILYFILPHSEFANMPMRSVIIEILVSLVILPLVNQLADPDYINSLIVWACTDIPITSELYVSVIKTTTDVEELEAVRKIVSLEVNQLRSRDSGGRDEGTEVKQQIASLDYLKQIIDVRINRLGKGSETDSLGLPMNFDYRHLARGKLFQLPLDAILKNSLTLDHFINYMTSVNCQHYVNLYLNIECWKTSVSERLCALELERIHHLQEMTNEEVMPGICHDYFSSHDLTIHKAEADIMYEQYLSEKAYPRIMIDDSIVKRLILRLRSEKLNENWFDEVQLALFNTMMEADLFLPAFRRSVWYIRLLAELDLLRDISRSDEEDSQSLDDISLSCLDQGEDMADGNLQSYSRGSSRNPSPQTSLNPSPCHTRTPSLSSRPYTITAFIRGTDIVREGNRSHAIYSVCVQRKDYTGLDELWHVFRRYSEFHDFHLTLCSKFVDLSSVPFPSKKMLNNLAAWFLEKRMNELNEWLATTLRPATLQSHPGMQDLIFKFLDHTPYHSSQPPPNLARKVEDSFVAPIRVGVKSMSDAVKSVPDTVINTVDGVVDGIYRKLVKNSQTSRFPAGNGPDLGQRGSIDLEGEENIPLRIVLLLMDEVFDLRSKDQWFRRRIVLFLRQILKAMFGDIVNRKIIDFVGFITSPEQVASYIKSFKETIWPNGKLSLKASDRDKDLQLRTRIAAKTCMLASISDEFKAILGTQTTSRGVMSVYDCVQWKPLNKRLIYVLLQGIIESLLNSQKQIPSVLRSLLSGSNRVSSRNQPPNPWKTGKIIS